MSIKKTWTSWIGILTIVGLIAVACSTAEPEVVEKVVTQVVKETVVVEGTPQIVEKEVTVVVTAESEETAASESEEDSRYGGTLRFGMLSDPQNWTPYNVIDCQNEVVMAQIWSSLLRYNGDSELVGDLAESWEWVDDVTVVFHLRENVTWHNGDPFVADDVIQSMELRMDPEVSIDAAELEGSVASWEALDEHTVQLTLVQPNVSILRKLTSVPGHGFILHPDWDEATSGQSAETSVGTGPFMYASYEPGVAVELVRNPNYFIEGLPYLDGIKFAIVADDQARITGLRAGDLDIIEYVDFQSLPMLRENPNIVVPDALGFYGARMPLGMNLAPTDDVRVRHAMNYAVDREMIVDAVLAGEGEPIWGSIIPPGAFGYAPELADYYSFDPAKAAELLEEAGWTDTDGDGIRDKDGQPMIVTYVTYGPSWWSQAGEVIKANLLDVGIECELEVLPWADYKTVRQENMDLPDGEPGAMNMIGSTLWGLDIIDFYAYVEGIYNFNRYNNPQVREKIQQALVATDDAEREALYKEAQALVMEDAPWIAPCWISRAEGVRNSVRNFQHLNETACYGTLLWETYLDNN